MPGDDGRSKTPEGVFGKELLYYRERAGLTQTELAALVNISHDVISKIEKGRRGPADDLPVRLDALDQLDTRSALARLWENLRDASRNRAYPGWFVPWPEYEAKATALRTFQLMVVPGLLQTPDYARAVLRTRVGITEDDIEAEVAARMARQAVLDGDKPPLLWVVLTEVALRHPVGGPEVMRVQLAKLAAAARLPHVIIQVIPTGRGAHEGFRGPFILAEFPDRPPAAYQDTAVSGQVIENAAEIAGLMTLWDTLKSEALPRDASLALIEEVAETWT